jgi:hypothetical protein
MKKQTYLVLGLALAGLTACANLDEQLVGSVTTQYFSTGAGLDAALNGNYSLLRGFWGREEMFAITEFGTDIQSNGDQGGYIFENTYAAGLNAADGHYQFPWTNFYRAINTSNAVIGRAPAITDMAATTKATRIAEAKFLRALNYFWVVQTYGPAPLSTTEAQGASNQAHRSPVDSIYLLIVQDLRDAIKDLPAVQSQAGRATKGAAQHLLAKVLLTRAYHPFAYEAANASFYLSGATFLREAGATSATDFTSARAEADSVITSGTYTLQATYSDIFCGPMGARGPGSYCTLPSNQMNSEIIFAVQFSTVSGQFTTNLGNTNFVQNLSFYDDRQGMARNCWDGRAFRRARPTLFARNLWQRWVDSTHATVLDTRYDGTFQSVWYANWSNTGACTQTQGAGRGAGYVAGTCAGGSLPAFGATGTAVPNCTNGANFVIGDTAIWQPGYILGGAASCTATGCSQAQRQAVKYAIYEPCVAEPCPNQTTIGQYDIFRYPTMKKWQDDARPDFNNQDGGRNVILARLGETYLIAAEAALGAGDAPGARGYLVTLRQRAAVGANKTLIVDATHMPATVDLEYIMDERARELYGEGFRFQDLQRTGLWHRVVDNNRQASPVNFNPGAPGFFNEAKHHLRPIPQNQIDLTAGGVQSFPQNFGY